MCAFYEIEALFLGNEGKCVLKDLNNKTSVNRRVKGCLKVIIQTLLGSRLTLVSL